MDTNKLKHCPFCNEIACIGIDVDGIVSGTVGAAQVSCIYCGVTTPFFVDIYDAVETWNARYERTCKVTYDKHGCPYCGECGCVLYSTSGYCPDCGVRLDDTDD